MGPITTVFNKGAQRDAKRRLAAAQEQHLRQSIMSQVHNQIWHKAYKMAREAGLDVNTADACAMRVVEEFREGRPRLLRDIINQAITEHVQS